MKVITLNVNGIRSANSKGLFQWLERQNADIICLQEIKAQLDDIPKELINWNGYHCEFHLAQKKGYSGVAIYAKEKPLKTIVGIGDKLLDDEGRYIQFDYPKFSVVSLYLPSGSSGIEKQQNKFRFMDLYKTILQNISTQCHNQIICGDWNIAHNEIDLKNWKGNIKNSGFLPEERAWLTEIFQYGFIDTWRKTFPEIPGYTWWSNRGNAYLKDVGWRIDYQIATPNLANKVINAQIYKEIKFSDHAPLIVEYLD